MTEINRIIEQLSRKYGGDPWYGLSVHAYHAGQIAQLRKALGHAVGG
jgi:hypothetical protein